MSTACAVCGPALQCPVDHLGHLVILVGAGPPRLELVVQALQAKVPVTLAPLGHGHARQAHPLENYCVGVAGCASQNDLRPLHDRMGQRPLVSDALKLLNLVVAKIQRRNRASNCHGTAPLRSHSIF